MIELLVTMVLMTIVLTGLAALQLQTIRQVTVSRRANEATRLAQTMVERYQSMSFGQLSAQSGSTWIIPKNPADQPMQNVAVDGVSGGPYTVQQLVEDIGSGSRLIITVRVSWLDVSPGVAADPAQSYQTQSVIMTTQRTP